MNTTVSKQSPINPRPQSLSSSNTNNTSNSFDWIVYEISLSRMSCSEIAEQFHRYDNDDGRSSRAHQNLNDEQCFNQLCNEFCSECIKIPLTNFNIFDFSFSPSLQWICKVLTKMHSSTNNYWKFFKTIEIPSTKMNYHYSKANYGKSGWTLRQISSIVSLIF